MAKKSIIFIILILALIAGGVFWWWYSKELPEARIEKQIQELEKQLEEKEGQLKDVEEIKPEELAEELWEAMTPRPLHATEDQKVEGVIVIQEGEKKIIKNEAQGYTIEVPPNLLLTRCFNSSSIELHDPETMCGDPQCYPEIQVQVQENPQKLSLEEYLRNEAEKEKLVINAETAYRIVGEDIEGGVHFIPGSIWYYFVKNDKIYIISYFTIYDSQYREYIETFQFE